MTPKPGTRPFIPVGSFHGKNAKMAAEQTAFALSGIGANGKPIVFEACRKPSGHPQKSSGKWAIIRTL